MFYKHFQVNNIHKYKISSLALYTVCGDFVFMQDYSHFNNLFCNNVCESKITTQEFYDKMGTEFHWRTETVKAFAVGSRIDAKGDDQ